MGKPITTTKKVAFLSHLRGVPPNNGFSVSVSFITLALAHTLALTVIGETGGSENAGISLSKLPPMSRFRDAPSKCH